MEFLIQFRGLISGKLAVGDNKGAYRIFKVAIAIFGLLGSAGTATLYLFAKQIANKYLGIPEAELTIIALSPAVFLVTLASVLKGYFNGKNKITITASSQAIEQITKTIIAMVLVEIIASVSNNNIIAMTALAASATTISALLSSVYLYVCYLKHKKEIWIDVITSTIKRTEGVWDIIHRIVLLSIPITITAVLASFNKTIDAVTIVNIISRFFGKEKAKFEYGILTGKIEGLIMLPYSFNVAFATTLIPTIAALQARGEMNKALKRIEFSILATILITLPCAASFFIFPDQILKMLFPRAYLGTEMLRISSISIFFVATTQTIGGVLHGLRKVKEPLIAIGVGSIVKLILNLILVPIYCLNIYGAIIASIVSHIIVFSINYYYLIKYTRFRINITRFIMKPILATLIMVIGSITMYNIGIFETQSLNLVLALALGLLIYIVVIISLKIITKKDFDDLKYKNENHYYSKAKTF